MLSFAGIVVAFVGCCKVVIVVVVIVIIILVQPPNCNFVSLFIDGRNHIVLVCWICGGIRRKGELCVVNMIDVCVEVDGVISHGVDLANALELKVV